MDRSRTVVGVGLSLGLIGLLYAYYTISGRPLALVAPVFVVYFTLLVYSLRYWEFLRSVAPEPPGRQSGVFAGVVASTSTALLRVDVIVGVVGLGLALFGYVLGQTAFADAVENS